MKSARSFLGWGLVSIFVSFAIGSAACGAADDDGGESAEQRATDSSGDTPKGARKSPIDAGTAEGGQETGEGECGFYRKKTCDPSQVITYYKDNIQGLLEDASDCLGCGGMLIGAGVIAMGGTVSGGLVSVPAGALATAVAALGCESCVHELTQDGVIPLIDCSIAPCEYSTDARQKECKLICQTDYAYVPRGGFTCMCTNSLKEVECRLTCDEGFTLTDDCKCNAPPGGG